MHDWHATCMDALGARLREAGPVHEEHRGGVRLEVWQGRGGHHRRLRGLRGRRAPGAQLLLQQRLQRARIKVACAQTLAGRSPGSSCHMEWGQEAGQTA